MKYQLVLQIPLHSMADYDQMVELENAIIERIGDLGEVDGHDAGSDEMNVFILTNDPQLVFHEVKPLLGATSFHDIKAAYRERKQDTYTILYPDTLKEFGVK